MTCFNVCLATPNHDIRDVNQRLAMFWLALRVISNEHEYLMSKWLDILRRLVLSLIYHNFKFNEVMR